MEWIAIFSQPPDRVRLKGLGGYVTLPSAAFRVRVPGTGVDVNKGSPGGRAGIEPSCPAGCSLVSGRQDNWTVSCCVTTLRFISTRIVSKRVDG